MQSLRRSVEDTGAEGSLSHPRSGRSSRDHSRDTSSYADRSFAEARISQLRRAMESADQPCFASRAVTTAFHQLGSARHRHSRIVGDRPCLRGCRNAPRRTVAHVCATNAVSVAVWRTVRVAGRLKHCSPGTSAAPRFRPFSARLPCGRTAHMTRVIGAGFVVLSRITVPNTHCMTSSAWPGLIRVRCVNTARTFAERATPFHQLARLMFRSAPPDTLRS